MRLTDMSSARRAFRCGFALLVTSIAVGIPASGQALKAPHNYDPAVVAQQFARTDQQLRLVVAHRGIWKNGECPENSHCAFYRAKQVGVEAVEVDVKRSRSGTLWALHDRYIGRVTTYRPAGQYGYFDQSEATGPGNGNALVSDLTDAEIAPLFLRYVDGAVSNAHPYTVASILQNIRDDGNVAAMLDLKTAVDVEEAAAIVRSLEMERTVILKFPSSLYDPLSGMPSYLNGLLYVPVVYAQDLPRLADADGTNQGLQVSQQNVERWLLASQGPNFSAANPYPTGALYVEFGMKSPNGEDPLRFAYNFSTYSMDQGVGSFQPIPDASGGRYYLDGGGYYYLNQFLARNIAPFPDETTDDRENSDFMLHYMNSIITDDPVSLISLASSQGYRAHMTNLCYSHNCAF